MGSAYHSWPRLLSLKPGGFVYLFVFLSPSDPQVGVHISRPGAGANQGSLGEWALPSRMQPIAEWAYLPLTPPWALSNTQTLTLSLCHTYHVGDLHTLQKRNHSTFQSTHSSTDLLKIPQPARQRPGI